MSRRFGLRKRWMVLRHLLAFGVTVAVVMAVVLIGTSPFVAVLLLIDDDTPLSTFVTVYAMAVGAWTLVVCVGTLTIAAVAVVLERLTLRGGWRRVVPAALLPFAVIAAMVGCVYVLFKHTPESSAAFYTLEIAFGLMFLFVIYWPILWLQNLVGYALTWLYRRARRYLHARRAAIGPAGHTGALTDTASTPNPFDHQRSIEHRHIPADALPHIGVTGADNL